MSALQKLAPESSLESVVYRYYAYRSTTSIGFYLPVSVAYLVEVRGFGLDAVGVIMAAYLVTMLVAEIPTGYFGDRIGRRASLAVGNALMAGSLVAWTVLQAPVEYLLVNVVWATGTTFRSGTADAWLYELLQSHDGESEFAQISGRATAVRFVVSASSAVAAGGLVALDWRLPFLANATLAALGVPIVLSLPAVERERNTADEDGPVNDAFRVREAVRVLRIQAGRPDVRWFVAYAALFYGLFQVGMAFEQPALNAVGVPVTGLGLLYAGFKLVSAGAASTTGWIQQRLGARGFFAVYAPVVGLAFASVAVWPIALVPALFLSRGLNAVARPIRNQYLNDRLANLGRATVLSGASMVLSLFAAGADVLGGVIAAATGPVRFLAGAGVATAGAAGLLWFAVSPVRDRDEPTPAEGQTVAASD